LEILSFKGVFTFFFQSDQIDQFLNVFHDSNWIEFPYAS
jgi:hypothetical protein